MFNRVLLSVSETVCDAELRGVRNGVPSNARVREWSSRVLESRGTGMQGMNSGRFIYGFLLLVCYPSKKSGKQSGRVSPTAFRRVEVTLESVKLETRHSWHLKEQNARLFTQDRAARQESRKARLMACPGVACELQTWAVGQDGMGRETFAAAEARSGWHFPELGLSQQRQASLPRTEAGPCAELL